MHTSKNFGFSKSESLRHKRLFETLFDGGTKHFSHPLMVVWKKIEQVDAAPLQVGFSVPKKHYKKAVKRNLIKRRLREAYRLQKHDLYMIAEARELRLAILFVVVKTDNISFDDLSLKMMLLLRNIASKISNVE